ncbi:unnamed protein product [Caretta caretta]
MSRPRSFALGRPLLLLLLLAACAALCRGAPMAGELRCQCVQTVSAVIPPEAHRPRGADPRGAPLRGARNHSHHEARQENLSGAQRALGQADRHQDPEQ